MIPFGTLRGEGHGPYAGHNAQVQGLRGTLQAHTPGSILEWNPMTRFLPSLYPPITSLTSTCRCRSSSRLPQPPPCRYVLFSDTTLLPLCTQHNTPTPACLMNKIYSWGASAFTKSIP